MTAPRKPVTARPAPVDPPQPGVATLDLLEDENHVSGWGTLLLFVICFALGLVIFFGGYAIGRNLVPKPMTPVPSGDHVTVTP